MDSENKASEKHPKMHPLTAAAAVALILASLTGIAAMTGLLPNFSKNTPPVPVAATGAVSTNVAVPPPVAPPVTPANPVVIAAAPEPAPVPKPAPPAKVVHKKPVKKPAAPVATTEPDHRAYRNSPIHAYCPSCGVVESVRAIQQEAPASGIGAGVGAVVGGLLGNQVGNGNGRTLATIAGALGGGYAGNVIEKKRQVTTSYEVIVRMENGNRQRFMMNEQRWMAGDLVYVDNGNLSPR